MSNIYAYTEPGSDCPAYISINEHSHSEVAVSVRSSGSAAASEIVMYQDELIAMMDAIEGYLCEQLP